ncbi:MAG: phosphate regulon sensor histidine kinase PhoR [Gammaproteobacteria bacterium]
MSRHWQEELLLFLVIMLLTGLTGLLAGQLLPGLLLGLLGYNGWHLYRISRLPHLLAQDGQDEPRQAGLWKGIIGNIRDLHAGNDTRQRDLLDLLKHFRETVNTLPVAVVILDTSGRVDWSNPAAEKLLGVVSPDARGRLLTALAPDPVLREYLAGGDFDTPLVITSPANRAKILSVFIASLQGEARRLLIVAQDITRLYYLDTARRDFVANVSHELRSPLTVIAGLAEQLNTDEPDLAILPRSIELIVQQAARMNELVSDLLTLSQLEMQQDSASDEHVHITELLTTIVEEARALSGAAEHELRLEIGTPDGLRGNAKELRTAFSNLVFNAIKHTPNQAQVVVRWQVDATGARFSVTDSGEGIAARHIPRLTERLYRVDASHSRDTGGTGLGLAIVKHVLDRHEVELEIVSEVGGGSTFTCHFPAARLIP